MKLIFTTFLAITGISLILWGCSTVPHDGSQNAASSGANISIDSKGTSTTAKFEKAKKDSIAHAKMITDSLRMEKLLAVAQYPYIKGTKWSGIIPVVDPTEIPDLKQDYKLLFELSDRNPDSLAKDINGSLDEVARVLNLHFASGIPAKKIIPVIVIHGPAIEAVMTNERYKKKHSIDNPNLKLVQDLENVGAKFIVCGQAMAFSGTQKEDLLPEIKISLTAQTVLSNYQLQGYVLYSVKQDK
jgi:intracellular sulfur oxidation DsrE/DsrF family protein